MHAGLLALIEFVFVLLIGVIIYNSSQGKNAQLSSPFELSDSLSCYHQTGFSFVYDLPRNFGLFYGPDVILLSQKGSVILDIEYSVCIIFS